MGNRVTSGGRGLGGESDDRRDADRRAGVRRSSQAVLRDMIDRLPDGIVVVSGAGTIRFANPASATLFGRTVPQMVGREFGFPLAGKNAAEIEIVRRGGVPVVAELRVVEATWDDAPASLVSLRDVTDRKHAEAHARQLERERAARAEAEAANHAKTEFLAVMSHELRTPLNAVLGYAELLELGVAGSMSPEQRQQVSRITSSGRHLLGLVNELLDLAKVEAGRLVVARVPASVAEIVEAAVVLAQPQAEARGLTIQASNAIRQTRKFLGDPDRALQILVNLISNAVKFSHPGGSFEISADVVAGTDESRHLHGVGPWVVILVRDAGIGVGVEQLESIFAPFVQAQGGHTRRSGGTGLGLTISRRLARLMHGDLTVQSTLGAGSTFTLWLPAATPRNSDPRVSTDEQMAIVPGTRGLGEIGDGLLREIEAILDGFVARLRREAISPAVATLKHTQLADHTAALLADIASALVTLDESGGTPSALLADSADLHRLIADRHGAQRARLGWTTEALRRESEILTEEVESMIRHCFPAPSMGSPVSDAIEVTRRYLEQAALASRRALERTLRAQRTARE